MPNTREKLIEILADLDCNAEYCKDCEFCTDIDGCVRRQKEIIADRLIANGVTIRQRIPVKERLPEVVSKHNTGRGDYTDSIRVLCACVKADGKKMVKEGYCRVYSNGYIRWKIPGTIHTVTHWMPLPKPPKGE